MATAVVGVLTELVRKQPVLIAIDDVQWVDLASRRALEFAARRLPAQLRLCVTRRSEGAVDVPLELDRALPPAAFERVVLGSLSLASLHHIVRERLGATPTRPVIARIAEASGGNPFFAIEIARAIGGRTAGLGDHGPLPVPQSVQKLAAERVNALSGAAREAVLVAASLSRPTADAVVTALPDEPDGGAAIAEAEDAGVIVTEHGRIRFTHPLLASAVYASVSEARRRALHRRLAEVVSDAEERARHLSQSLTEADESVAIQIEGAARQAVLRGAFDASAELFGAACRLTPASNRESLVRRRMGQASALLRTGDVADARRLAEGMEMDGLPPASQAERLQLLAEVEWDDGSIPLATSYLERALKVAGNDPPLSRADLRAARPDHGARRSGARMAACRTGGGTRGRRTGPAGPLVVADRPVPAGSVCRTPAEDRLDAAGTSTRGARWVFGLPPPGSADLVSVHRRPRSDPRTSCPGSGLGARPQR